MASDDADDFEANVISYNSTMSSFARSFRWDTATEFSMHGRSEPKGDLRFEPAVQVSFLCSHCFFLQFFSLLLPLHLLPFLVTSPFLSCFFW